MSVLHITEENFEQEVVNSNKKVLLDFWATWCGPCRMIAPYLEEIAAENPDIVVGKINVDEEPALAASFQVMSIPMLAVIENGEVIDTTVGARPKEDILKFVKG